MLDLAYLVKVLNLKLQMPLNCLNPIKEGVAWDPNLIIIMWHVYVLDQAWCFFPVLFMNVVFRSEES